MTVKRPDAETIQRIDYVIQGLQNGRYKQIPEAVEFHEKLKGEEPPTYIQSLLDTIDDQSIDINKLSYDLREAEKRITDHENRIQDLENMLRDYIRNMRGIANGLVLLGNPDPFNQSYDVPNRHDADQFINDYKGKYS